MSDRQKFAILRAARRVWAIGSIHGEAERLERLHGRLWRRLEPGDRIVYLGNFIGRGPAVAQTLDQLLTFRREALSRPRSFVDDIVYLRGAQEEMWHKLLQLQFATSPTEVLEWMFAQGVGPTLEAYGGKVEEARREAHAGTVSLTRWTGRLRAAMQAHPGHVDLFSALRRAALTDDGGLLFVNTGLDPSRPLEAQNDSFWWSSNAFARIEEPYAGYKRVVRGYCPSHPGLQVGDFTATVDGGCGCSESGTLMAACFLPGGELADRLNV